MNPVKTRRSNRRNYVTSLNNPLQMKGLAPEQTFFSGSSTASFFKPSVAYGMGEVVQAKCDACEKEDAVQKKGMSEEEETVQAKGAAGQEQEEVIMTPTYSERAPVMQNTRHFANCEGVRVEGHTDANYGNSFTAPGTSAPAKDCEGCSDEECVSNSGTVISVFTANPQITLPTVPAGLNECEQQAVQNFIDTTLRAHEQEHVAAFNTYRGTVRTPYTYKGCAGGLDAHLQEIHDNIETPRKTASDAASAALDANGANIFEVTCECPDPEPEPEPEQENATN
jgi:hypothetical protein